MLDSDLRSVPPLAALSRFEIIARAALELGTSVESAHDEGWRRGAWNVPAPRTCEILRRLRCKRCVGEPAESQELRGGVVGR